MGVDALYMKFKEYKHAINKHHNEDGYPNNGDPSSAFKQQDNDDDHDDQPILQDASKYSSICAINKPKVGKNVSEFEEEVARLKAQLKAQVETIKEPHIDEKSSPQELLGRLSLSSKKAIAMKVMVVSNVYEVMQGIIGMAGMVSTSPSRKRKGISINQQKLDDLDVVVGWALKERVQLVGIKDSMVDGGILRLSMENIKDR